MIKNTEKIVIRVTEEKKKEYQAVADKLGITMTGLIKTAVNDYIKKN